MPTVPYTHNTQILSNTLAEGGGGASVAQSRPLDIAVAVSSTPELEVR